MIYKENFNSAKKYWNAFWEKEVLDRPLICVAAPRNNIEIPLFDNSPAANYRSCMEETFLANLQRYERFAAAHYYAGEAVPAFTIDVGPDAYAGFLGARIETHEGADTTWSHPCVSDWKSFEVKIDKSPGSYFDKLKRYFEFAAEYSKDKFLLNMLDLHSNLDALSALRGPQDLCFDIMDEPDEVHRVLKEVRKTYPEIFDMPYVAGDMVNRGSTGWAPTYLEKGKFAVIQCDFSCLLSPDQAREFVLPALREEAAFLDRCVYHYDGKSALGHIDDILAIEDIDVIQWVPGDGEAPTYEWMDLLHKIQAAGKGLWIYDWSAEMIKSRFKELKPEGLVFSLGTQTEAQADELVEYVTKHM